MSEAVNIPIVRNVDIKVDGVNNSPDRLALGELNVTYTITADNQAVLDEWVREASRRFVFDSFVLLALERALCIRYGQPMCGAMRSARLGGEL